jgi:hypothetical protein
MLHVYNAAFKLARCMSKTVACALLLRCGLRGRGRPGSGAAVGHICARTGRDVKYLLPLLERVHGRNHQEKHKRKLKANKQALLQCEPHAKA